MEINMKKIDLRKEKKQGEFFCEEDSCDSCGVEKKTYLDVVQKENIEEIDEICIDCIEAFLSDDEKKIREKIISF
jgi:hypothetical protein